MKTFSTKAFLPFAAALLAMPFFTNAQLTITHAQNFNFGDVLKFIRCDATGLQPGESGADVTWDFSNIAAYNDTITEWIVSPSATPYASQFPAANLVEKYSDGRFVFLNKTADQSELVGFKDTINNITAHYPDPVLIGQRPLSYGDSTVDAFTAQLQVGVAMQGSGNVTLHADGYGTLVLPNATYTNVLRVKISQVEVDTIAGFGTATTYVENYLWFDNAHASALLKIDTTYTTTGYTAKNASYLLEEITSVEPRSKPFQNIVGTFVQHRLVLFGSFNNNSTIELYDAAGRLCSTKAVTNDSFSSFDAGFLPSGLYGVLVKQNGKTVGRTKVVKAE